MCRSLIKHFDKFAILGRNVPKKVLFRAIFIFVEVGQILITPLGVERAAGIAILLRS